MPFYKTVAGAASEGAATPIEVAGVAVASGNDRVISDWTFQNEGGSTVTIYARIKGASVFGIVGTIDAGAIKVIYSLKAVTAFKVVGSGNTVSMAG